MQPTLLTDFGFSTPALKPVRALAQHQLQHVTETTEERRKRYKTLAAVSTSQSIEYAGRCVPFVAKAVYGYHRT